MSDEDRQRAEVEIVAIDSASVVFKEIGKQLDVLKKQAVDAGGLGADALERFNKQSTAVAANVSKSATAVTGFTQIVANLQRSLVGPIGVAAGFVAAGQALEKFALSGVTLRTFARDVGIAHNELLKLRQTLMSETGVEQDVADQSIAKLSQYVTNIKTYKQGAPEYQAMQGVKGGQELLDKIVGAKSTEEAMGIAVERYQKLKDQPASQQLLSDAYGVPKSILDALTPEKLAATKIRPRSDDDLNRQSDFHKRWLKLKESVKDNVEDVEMKGVEAGNAITDFFGKLFGGDKKTEGGDEKKKAGDSWLESVSKSLNADKGEATERTERARDSTRLLGDIADTLKKIEDPDADKDKDKKKESAPQESTSLGERFLGERPSPATPPPAGKSSVFPDPRFNLFPRTNQNSPAVPPPAPAPEQRGFLRGTWDAIRQSLDPSSAWERREHGGQVAAGKPYLVGEKGPELFIPHISGMVSVQEKLQLRLDETVEHRFNPVTAVTGSQQPPSRAQLDGLARLPEFPGRHDIEALTAQQAPPSSEHLVSATVDFGRMPKGKPNDVFLPISLQLANQAPKSGSTTAPSPRLTYV